MNINKNSAYLDRELGNKSGLLPCADWFRYRNEQDKNMSSLIFQNYSAGFGTQA